MTAIALEMVLPAVWRLDRLPRVLGFRSPVGNRMRSWIATLRDRGLAAQLGVLGLAVLVIYAVVAPVAGGISGLPGLAASASAAAACLLGAGAGLIASRGFSRRDKVLQGFLVGAALRMAVPLASALALQLCVKPLAEAYLLIYFLVFYPVTLFVETFLSLPRAGAARAGEGRSPEVPS